MTPSLLSRFSNATIISNNTPKRLVTTPFRTNPSSVIFYNSCFSRTRLYHQKSRIIGTTSHLCHHHNNKKHLNLNPPSSTTTKCHRYYSSSSPAGNSSDSQKSPDKGEYDIPQNDDGAPLLNVHFAPPASLFDGILQHRYAVFVNGQQIISNQFKWMIIGRAILQALALITILYLLLSFVERFRKRYNITLGSLRQDATAAVYGIIGLACSIMVFSISKQGREFVLRRMAFLAGEVGVIPPLASIFCHSDLIHLAFNMIALNSFGPTMGVLMGPEHFLWAFLTGGILACLSTTLIDLLFLKRQMLCVGASGGLFFILGMFSVYFPDRQLQIIFLPFYSFSVEKAIMGLFLFDAAGLLLQKSGRHSPLGHAAHLGGLLSGIAYAKFFAHHTWKPNGVYPNILYNKTTQYR